LTITADGKSWSTYYATRKYTGSAGFINDYYAQLGKSQVLKKYNFGNKTYQLPEKEFIKAIDNYFFVRDSIKNEYFHKTVKSKQLQAFLLRNKVYPACSNYPLYLS